MKQRELKHCAGCGRGIMHDGKLVFYRLRVEQFIIDVNAVKRQHGLEMMMDSPALAQVLGPDPDIAQCLDEGNDVLLCLDCAATRPVMAVMLDDDDTAEVES